MFKILTTKEYNKQQGMIQLLRETIVGQDSLLDDPTNYIKRILNKDIAWYDYEKLGQQEQMEYYAEAQRIIVSNVFVNELHHYMKDLMEEGFTNSKNFDQLMHLRASFVTLETFKKRLEEVKDPKKAIPTTENIHEPI